MQEDDPDPDFRTYCHLFAARRPWRRGCIDELLRDIADEKLAFPSPFGSVTGSDHRPGQQLAHVLDGPLHPPDAASLRPRAYGEPAGRLPPPAPPLERKAEHVLAFAGIAADLICYRRMAR
ncbi:DUF3885 domain-containing protein [Streptomyces canus]|uniref:DUF3885 domain-containing protein n=1 Tax=Streptomyces canus TaxID=58343 RepID=UPI003F4B16BA